LSRFATWLDRFGHAYEQGIYASAVAIVCRHWSTLDGLATAWRHR
jgi:hypothetical protein